MNKKRVDIMEQTMDLLSEINKADTGKKYSIDDKKVIYIVNASYMDGEPFTVFMGSKVEVRAFVLGLSELCL